MAIIFPGTTGKADVTFTSLPQSCYLCHQANTFGFDLDSTPCPPGWNASYDDETVTVPLDAEGGDYLVTVRSDPLFDGFCVSVISGPCKHLVFTVPCMVVNIAMDGTEVEGSKRVVKFKAVVTGGHAPFTYSWAATGDFENPTGWTSETFEVEMGSNSYIDVSVTVTDDDTPDPCVATCGCYASVGPPGVGPNGETCV